jgi:hypothetical protein
MSYLPEVRQGKLILKKRNGSKRRGERKKVGHKNRAQALEGICAHDRLHLQALGLVSQVEKRARCARGISNAF